MAVIDPLVSPGGTFNILECSTTPNCEDLEPGYYFSIKNICNERLGLTHEISNAGIYNIPVCSSNPLPRLQSGTIIYEAGCNTTICKPSSFGIPTCVNPDIFTTYIPANTTVTFYFSATDAADIPVSANVFFTVYRFCITNKTCAKLNNICGSQPSPHPPSCVTPGPGAFYYGLSTQLSLGIIRPNPNLVYWDQLEISCETCDPVDECVKFDCTKPISEFCDTIINTQDCPCQIINN